MGSHDKNEEEKRGHGNILGTILESREKNLNEAAKVLTRIRSSGIFVLRRKLFLF